MLPVVNAVDVATSNAVVSRPVAPTSVARFLAAIEAGVKITE